MRNGDHGSEVSQLQRQLKELGITIEIDGWYGESTAQAVAAFQSRVGLIADGVAGPKTLEAIRTRDKNPKHLGKADIERAAARLGVAVAAIMAVSEVEGKGKGFGDDGRPLILFERHVLHRLLDEAGIKPETLEELVTRYPNVVNPKRGGYSGGNAEWARLACARQISAAYPFLAEQCCSWGQYQIMGYHWHLLGFETPEAFVAAMHSGEAAHLDAFARFIEADPALLKALKGKKWADFARLYNGPAYKENLYDVKMARAFDLHSGE